MKPETLESLLIDRALGGLPPEVDELLAAHLRLVPAAARQADGLAATVRRAREAVAAPATTPQRPLAVARLQAALRTQRWRALAGEGLRLAACVALGLAIGWRGHAVRRPVPPAAAPLPARSATVPAAPPPADFWSLAKLETVQRRLPPPQANAADRYRLRWDSPVKMPSLEDNL